MTNTIETAREMAMELDPKIMALWALIMGHFAGRPASCTCCDTLSHKDDEKREEILDIFRKMGFEETINGATRDYFALANELRLEGKWYGWPFKTLPLVEKLLLRRLLEDAPRVLEANSKG